MRPLAQTIMALALCAGCSQRQSDLEQARTARSLLAEWALLAGMSPDLPQTYARQMRDEAQGELDTVAASARKAAGTASRAIAAVADIQGSPSPGSLHRRVRAARGVELSLETR